MTEQNRLIMKRDVCDPLCPWNGCRRPVQIARIANFRCDVRFCPLTERLELPKRTLLSAVVHSLSGARSDLILGRCCGASRRSADRSHLAAVAAAAEERIAAIRLEARYGDAGRHVDLLQNLAGLRIDPAQFALLGFPGAVPELVADPGDAGDEAVRTRWCAGSRRSPDRPGGSCGCDVARPRASLPPRPFRRRRLRVSEWWRPRGRSPDRPSGCGPRRSGTGAGRRRRFPHARGHRARAPSCRSPGRSRSACRRSRSRHWCRHS